RPCRLPTSHRDRFRLDPIHDRRIPSIQKESCSPPRHHLNACRPGHTMHHRHSSLTDHCERFVRSMGLS
ncbi:MAG: hypothetical protein WBP81_10880, partial [Solirubrobacteraceae bacterium]